MRREEIWQALLAFEDRLEVLDHRLDSERMLLWPLARWRVVNFPFESVATAPTSPRVPLVQRVRHVESSLRRDPLRVRRRFDVLMFGSTVGISEQRAGKWFGRINDYFALERPEQTLVVDAAQGHVLREPRVPPHVRAHDAIWIRAALRARLARGPSSADRSAVARFLRFLRAELPVTPSEAQLDALRGHLERIAARIGFMRAEYMRLFERTRPALLCLEDGSYGGQSYLLRFAREAGIRTAEPQHGMIAPGHQAYNYAPRLCQSPLYRDYSPEFLLTYGAFWERQVKSPSRPIAIGNPHFETMRDATPRARDGGRTVAVISQPAAAAELVGLARELSATLPRGDSLVYRLHPHERASSAPYDPLRGLPNVRISEGGKLYELLAGADAVIGVTSTVLFEAAGLGCAVYVLANEEARALMPHDFGQWFASAGELPALLSAPRLGTVDRVDRDALFAPDWRARYAAFLNELGLARA